MFKGPGQRASFGSCQNHLPEAAKGRQTHLQTSPTLSYITELTTKSVTSNHPPLNLNKVSSHSS